MIKYVLIGVFNGHCSDESEDKKIACFTTKLKAQNYETQSRTENYNTYCGKEQHSNQYKKESLLYGFCHAYVEEQSIPISLILDPEIT